MIIGTFNIPTWALPFLVNGTDETLKDEEMQMLDSFIEKNNIAYILSWSEGDPFTSYNALHNKKDLCRECDFMLYEDDDD
jgi:hypothetical protein